MELSPGYRLCFPFLSVELKVHASVGMSGGYYYDYTPIFKAHLSPVISIRYDGLMHFFNPGSYTTDATIVSSQKIGSTTIVTRGQYWTKYTTTTTYNVKATPTTISFSDIGTFLGVGVKRTFSKNFVSKYTTPSSMWGGIFSLRRAWLALNLTYETGTIGHASSYTGQANEKFKFKNLDFSDNTRAGVADINSLYADVGVEINNFIMAVGGLVAGERGAYTPFFAVTVGHSFGHSWIKNQRFNSGTNGDFYNGLEDNQKNHMFDPRL